MVDAMSKTIAFSRTDSRRSDDRATVSRVAVIVSYILVATATALGLIAMLVRQDAAYSGAAAAGALQLLAFGGLALLGAIAAGVAAVTQDRRRISGWVALIASGVALLALLFASIPLG